MAANLETYKGRTTNIINEYNVDTEAEVALLPTMTTKATGAFKGKGAGFDETAPMGSMCMVGNQSGDVIVYKLFSFGWKKL